MLRRNEGNELTRQLQALVMLLAYKCVRNQSLIQQLEVELLRNVNATGKGPGKSLLLFSFCLFVCENTTFSSS